MVQCSLYTPYDLEILRPLGGTDFVEHAVRAVRTGFKAGISHCRADFADMSSCDVVGDYCRAKINEAVAGLAAASGLECTYEKPERQRYHSPVIRAGGTVLTVARMYGKRNVTRPSGLRCNLAQLRLFDLDDTRSFAYDDDVRALILAYSLRAKGQRYLIQRIELQEIGISPEDVTHRIDLLSKVAVQSATTQAVVFDDFDIKPKEGLLRKHA